MRATISSNCQRLKPRRDGYVATAHENYVISIFSSQMGGYCFLKAASLSMSICLFFFFFLRERESASVRGKVGRES